MAESLERVTAKEVIITPERKFVFPTGYVLCFSSVVGRGCREEENLWGHKSPLGNICRNGSSDHRRVAEWSREESRVQHQVHSLAAPAATPGACGRSPQGDGNFIASQKSRLENPRSNASRSQLPVSKPQKRQ